MPAVAIIAPVALAAIVLGAFRLARPGTLPNLRLAGISVGELNRDDLRKVVNLLVTERSRESVTVVRGGGPGAPRAASKATRDDLGYRVDVDATVGEVLRRGRQSNPLAALADHLTSTFVPLEVQPVERVDARVFNQWLSDTAKWVKKIWKR